MFKLVRLLFCVLILSVIPALGQTALTSSFAPTLTAISPTSVMVGSPALTLKVVGTRFVSGSTFVLWNGAKLATSFGGSTQLMAQVPGTLLTTVGTVQIAVYVSGLRGGTSNVLLFAIKSGDSSTMSSPIDQSSSTTLALAPSVPQGVVGQTYKAALVSSGKGPYALNILSGGFPAGLTFDGSTGMLVGIPKAAASYAFAVGVKDTTGRTASNTYAMSIAPSGTNQSSMDSVQSSLVIVTTSLPAGAAGTAYSATLKASGGAPPYTWAITGGALPAGLTLTPATGVISGTPNAAGTYSFTVGVKDSTSHIAVYTYSVSIAIAMSKPLG
jgi:hypothetical protein